MRMNTILPAAATAVLLCGLWVQKLQYPKQGDADDYHRIVKVAIDAIPLDVDDWAGKDDNVPRTAIALLRPNAILSRRYVHRHTRQRVNFLIVQCRDARDMIGHYPPVCYPANGWTQKKRVELEWNVDGMRFEGTSYEFYKAFPTSSKTMYVTNVILLPDGNMPREMDAVRALAADYRKHFFGAAQIQMNFGGETSSDQRYDILETFLRTIADAFNKIRSGVEL